MSFIRSTSRKGRARIVHFPGLVDWRRGGAAQAVDAVKNGNSADICLAVVSTTNIDLTSLPSSEQSKSSSLATTRHREGKGKQFPFLCLPPELRNMIYKLAITDSNQVVLKHMPRLANLRVCYGALKRKTNRHAIGLTQVYHQIREEFYPIYLRQQEITFDLTTVNDYINSVASSADARFGSVIVGVSKSVSNAERVSGGFPILPMLYAWSHSTLFGVAFGRYISENIPTHSDAETRDLYRLLGRKIERNGTPSVHMNTQCAENLVNNHLLEVRVHRAGKLVTGTEVQGTLPVNFALEMPHGTFLPEPLLLKRGLVKTILPQSVINKHFPGKHNVVVMKTLGGPATAAVKMTVPYIHIIYKCNFKENYMVVGRHIQVEPHWFAKMGFVNMEHFAVKVGVLAFAPA